MQGVLILKLFGSITHYQETFPWVEVPVFQANGTKIARNLASPSSTDPQVPSRLDQWNEFYRCMKKTAPPPSYPQLFPMGEKINDFSRAKNVNSQTHTSKQQLAKSLSNRTEPTILSDESVSKKYQKHHNQCRTREFKQN